MSREQELVDLPSVDITSCLRQLSLLGYCLSYTSTAFSFGLLGTQYESVSEPPSALICQYPTLTTRPCIFVVELNSRGLRSSSAIDPSGELRGTMYDCVRAVKRDIHVPTLFWKGLMQCVPLQAYLPNRRDRF